MKKRLLSIFICFLIALFLVGCKDAKKEESKTELPEQSQEEKINLNDNVYYYEDIQLTNKDCGGFGFPSNVESVIDKNWISLTGNLKSVDRIELFSHDNIIYDEAKENEAKKEWDKLEKPSRGVKDFIKGYDNHEFYFGYWYINLIKDEEGNELSKGDKYYELSQKIHSELDLFNEKAYSIIKEKDGYRFNGTCGGPALEAILLDEAACDKYNLICDRW